MLISTFLDFNSDELIPPEPANFDTKLSVFPFNSTSPEPLRFTSKSVAVTSKFKSPEPDNLAIKLVALIVFFEV